MNSNNRKDTPLGKIYIAQRGRCFLCGKDMSLRVATGSKSFGWTREHFIPVSRLRKIGWEPMYNIVLSHKKCNAKKGSRFPTRAEVRKFAEIYSEVLSG